MSSKISSSSSVKGTPVGVGPSGSSSKRLAKLNKKQALGKAPSSAAGGRVNPETQGDTGRKGYTPIPTRIDGGPFVIDSMADSQEDQVIVHVVPPSSPVPLDEALSDPEDEIHYHHCEGHDPGDPTSASTSTPGGSVVPPESPSQVSRTGDTDEVVHSNQESDQFLDDEDEIDCSEDCDEEEEEEEESSECLGEEEEEEDEDEEDGDEECVTDEISEEEDETQPRKPLPQHRPQLPIAERTLSNKRRGRTPGGSGLSIGTAAIAIKRARGVAGIRTSKCTSVGLGTVAGTMGKSKSIVNSLRKPRRVFPTNTNPIFLHNSSSDEDDEEEEEEDDDMGDEYLERDESDEEEDEEPPEFLLSAEGDPSALQNIPPDAQARLEAFFEAAGFTDGKLMSDPESLRKLTLTVSSALGEASAAINRMRDSQRKSIEEGRSDSMEEGDSLLALACSSGYFELARVLLAMGANVDDRGSKGDLTPLMDAASQGHQEIVRLLLSHGADVNAQSACGNSALMYACASGHVAVVEELLKVGAHVEDNNENGHTPLMEAASAGHVPVARLLLSHGAGINTHSNEFKESALTVACYKGHLDMVRFLLEGGADQQHKTDEMHTALMEASMDGHVEVARLLLDSGAQVNMPADSFESPLTLAACGGHVELAELLLERGANIEEVNDEGYTPLMEAAREGHLCVVKALLKHNALVNAKTEETQETALTLAACGGFLDVVDILIKAGADIEAGASTPVMEAAQEGHLQVVRFLMEKGADIFRQNASQDIALSFAAENGHLDVVQHLVDAGSNAEHLSEGGRSPLMKAARGGHIDVIKYFLSKKSDVNRQTTSNDHTPLSLACAGGHLAAVELLLAVGANPYHKLKDNSTMVIEAARGGHTPVIRCLLDYLPPTMKAAAAKATTMVKQGEAMVKAAAPIQTPKSPLDPKSPAQAKAANPAVLRKCRSTSTLETAPPVIGVPAKDSGDAKTKVKVELTPSLQPATKVVPTKETLPPPKTTETVGVPVDLKSLPTQNLTSSDGKSLTVTDGGKVSSFPKGTESTTAGKKPSLPESCCSDCGKSSTPLSQTQPVLPPGHVHVKRPAAAETQVPVSHQQIPPSSSITVGTVTPTSSSAFTPVSSGPPLVASQVTAATAISERPKLKSKPRKTFQLQNQAQPGSVPLSQSSSSSGTSPGSSSEKGQLLTPIGSPKSPISPSTGGISTVPATPFGVAKGPAPLTSSSAPTGMLMELQVQQVLTNTGTPMDLKDLKLDTKQFSQILAQHQHQFLKKGASLFQGNLEQTSSTGAAGTTTTTTTTVVVTHGNGETETIFDGENLPPGANEVIMNAAAAAFPLDCFPLPSALQMAPSGEVHVQSYQVGGSGDGSTTTMQTTTIINAAASLNNFQQQLILPHHPPPLPAAMAAAAAAAGLLPASGAPPPGVLKGLSKKEQVTAKAPAVTSTPTPKVSGTSAPPGQPPIPVNQVPPVSSLAAPVGQKKQNTGKRTRQVSHGGSNARHANQHTQTPAHSHGTKHNHSVVSTPTPTTPAAAPLNATQFDVNTATESSGETSLSIAASSGHYEVVEFLLSRNARIEHKDKKGCTPLILAADGGYDKVVELLLSRGADIEAQSERTKDTALSLACTKGRFEVVDLLIKKGANKEHRNVSDYTPLSLAASGGYVNIIKLLLQNGAEINSRTGSKLGISPLMLAAMNGNTPAVKLLLDMGSDINAQIETNKNTALTLACFQGRQEVVSLLLDRKANLEHRAKTGLTPLMEAANGGYTEVGKILIEKGADVNAAPVPATKDTALTIAADKGHFRFVELLLEKNSMVEVRNKKGCTPSWLACNGGHLDVAQILYKHRADMDAQDNRKVSCLMAAFRKGHVKLIRWIVKNVQQFPSDGEMLRYYTSIQSESELLKKCQQCGDFIKQAKDKQALEANKNASILLEELDMERSREESKRQAAARRREKKKKKKQEKKQGPAGEQDDDDEDQDDEDEDCLNIIDSGIDANSLGSNSSTNGRSNKENVLNKEEKTKDLEEPKQNMSAKSRKRKNRKERERQNQLNSHPTPVAVPVDEKKVPVSLGVVTSKDILREKDNKVIAAEAQPEPKTQTNAKGKDKKTKRETEVKKEEQVTISKVQHSGGVPGTSKKVNRMETSKEVTSHYSEPPVSRKNISNFDVVENAIFSTYGYPSAFLKATNNVPPMTPMMLTKPGRKDDGWKEVTRSFPSSRSKKVIVPSSVISRVIGRGGCNINAIREATGAHIEVEKQQKGQAQPERTIQIKGTAESTKQAHTLITALMNEPDLDVKKLLPVSSGVATVTPFTTGTFSVPIASVATVSQRPLTTGAPVMSSASPPTVDNTPFTTFVSNSPATTSGAKSKSNKSGPSPPVVSQVSPLLQKPTTPVNGNSTSLKGASTSITKKPTPFVPKTNLLSNPGSCANSVGMSSVKPLQQCMPMSMYTPTTMFQQYRRPLSPNLAMAPFPGSITPTSSPVPFPSSSAGNGIIGEPKGIFTSATSLGNPTIQVITNSNAALGSLASTISTAQFQPPPAKEPLMKAPGSQNGKGFGGLPVQTARSSPSDVPMARNLAPGGSVIGPPGSVRSTSAVENEPVPLSSHQPQPLEFSPFNYNFSKSAGWFPGDLAQPSSISSSTGTNSFNSSNSQTVGSPLGHIGSGLNHHNSLNSSAARAMNFASVAASGISSTSLSTATAQMTHAGGLQNGGLVGSLGPGLTNIISVGGKGHSDSSLEADIPKADASKAPGYRGNTGSSPILRAGSMQQHQHIPSSIGGEHNMSTQFGGLQSGGGMINLPGQNLMGFGGSGRVGGMGMSGLSGLPNTQNFGMGSIGQEMGSGHGPQVNNAMMYGNNSGGHPLPGGISSSQPSVVSSSTVPTNVIMSSRLNPRAPSFTLSQHLKMGLPAPPSVSSFQQQLPPLQHQQQQIHNSFKLNSFGSRNNNMIPGGRQGPPINLTSWNPYGNDSSVLQNLAVLASATGTLDPQVLFPTVDPIEHDNQNPLKNEGRLPRPIGGERAWKNSGSNAGAGNLNNMGTFTGLECLDSNQIPQPISVQSTQPMPGQGQGWMGSMYGAPPQQFPPASNQQNNAMHMNHQRPGNDTRNFLGRRFIEDMDLQQMIDGQHRMMNGGLPPGPPMHMTGNLQPMMYPFGPPTDHLEQHLPPKVDQHTNSWDNHLHNLEEKHNMGWGAKWGN